MTVLSAPAWHRARAKRAARGKAPRLSLVRLIVLQQASSGNWSAAIRARRFGVWGKPEWLCGATTYEQALSAAMQGWRQYRLPLARATAADPRLLPFYVANPVVQMGGWK